jgi:hypothetical protein
MEWQETHPLDYFSESEVIRAANREFVNEAFSNTRNLRVGVNAESSSVLADLYAFIA